MLDYLMSLLNKPGRAVRGVLGGNPREALAALPFSDSLGATNPDEENTPDMLLRALGGDPDDGLAGTAQSLGVGLATDPLTYAGGALVRRLLGAGAEAGAAGKAGAESHIFDLVSPEERLASQSLGKIDDAFPLPLSPRSSRVPIRAELDPYTQAGQDATGPASELLTELPDPRTYQHMTGSYLRNAPAESSIMDDALLDRGSQEAFRTGMGTWDETLGDLERLHPEKRLELTGRAGDPHANPAIDAEDDFIRLGDPAGDQLVAATGGLSPTNTGYEWQGVLAQRLHDLEATRTLGMRGGIADWEAIDPLVSNQVGRIQKFLPDGPGQRLSQQGEFAKDLMAGEYRPGDVAGLAAEYAPHMPVDPRGLREVAANRQMSAMTGNVSGELFGLEDAGHAMTPAQILDELRAVLQPEHHIAAGIDPGIASQVLGHPEGLAGRVDPEQLRRIVEARQLLARMMGG